MERGALPARRAGGGGQLLRPGGSRGRRRQVPRRAARPRPADAPANPFRGVPLAERAGNFAANVALLTGQAGQDQAERDTVLRVWDAALAAPGYDGPPVWLHGDLHPANILVNDGQVSGVIDFGDITAGDPAGDLSVAWMLLPPGCHRGSRRRRAASLVRYTE
jgi:aminoglycoside phosphotransferase (APT) family kinase protein